MAAALDRFMLLEQNTNKLTIVNDENLDKHELLFESVAMSSLMQQVQLVAPTDASVLITGESGTGKEVIAEQIHILSQQPSKPFITVDCSTIVEHLIESELFGHRKGAFTGATHSQPGKIAQAEGGILFLDEVGELPLDIQSKLLRFVQEKTFTAVGDQRIKKVNVRLILATNRDLVEEVSAGRFRSDLYHRINVFTLNLPPLNQRNGDVQLLSRHYLRKYKQHYKKEISDFSESALAKLQNYPWPGNVRELKNCMMRAVILCSGGLILPEHLVLQQQSDASLLSSLTETATSGSPTILNQGNLNNISSLLDDVLGLAIDKNGLFSIKDWLEKQWIIQCLAKWGSLYQVAQQLNQSESTLRRRFAKLNDVDFEAFEIETLTIQCNQLLLAALSTDSPSQIWPNIELSLQQKVLQTDLNQVEKAKLLNVTQPTLRKIIKLAQFS